MSLSRTIRLSGLYGGNTYNALSFSETGDTEVVVNESIPAGESDVFPFAVTAANLKALFAWSDVMECTITMNTTDVILAADTGVNVWADGSGAATPLPSGNTTTVTCDNTGGATAANVFIAALSETP